MLYEYNKKIYIKPLVNKVAEVKVSKKGNSYDIEQTGDIIYITHEMKKAMVEITPGKQAYQTKSSKSTLDL